MALNPRFAVRNWTLKLTALFLAVLLWISVRVERPDRQVVQGLPVQVVVDDPDWTLVGDPNPATVAASFSGATRALLPVSIQPPTLRIVLDEISTADTILALSRDWVALPPESGVAVEELQPATIRLEFDRYETVSLPFAVPTVGPLDSTLALVRPPQVVPARGNVRAPSRRLSQLSQIPLIAMDPTDIVGSGVWTVAVDTAGLPDGVTVEATDVEVELWLEPRLTRTFVGIPVEVEGATEDSIPLEVDPATVDVTISGAASLVEAMTPFDIAVVTRSLPMPMGAEGVEVAVVVRNLPDLVAANLLVEQVRVRPQPAEVGSP